MLFNSLNFAAFFVIVTSLYFLLPHRFRWITLLMASCIFYMAFIPVYILILFVTITIDYFAGIWIENSQGKSRKWYLIMSIISTCLVLFIFKYFNFFLGNVAAMAKFLHWNYPIEILNIILPIGLSFHTFQSLSYVIEVYRNNQKAEHNFGIYSLYVMFYPQLVAGPIERPQNLLHQFYESHSFDFERVVEGFKLMAWGFFKKMIIADRLAMVVNSVYDNPLQYSGSSFILSLATVFFAFQIYCDFSGYSDIAIGCARVMGFKLMTNFDRPYFAKSIAEFWKRWHISLSTWFRDYLYISLGGNRATKPRWYFNLFITFLISGLWHGANWTYVIWGALNGIYLIFAILTVGLRKRLVEATGLNNYPLLHKLLQTMTTFLLICIAWVFFRAHNLSDALSIFSGILSFANGSTDQMWAAKKYAAGVGLCLITLLVFLEYKQRHTEGIWIFKFLEPQPVYVRWACYYCLILFFALFGVFHQRSEFIYFQF